MDLYTDYLLSSFDQVTATGLSNLLDGSISHDRVTRLLSGKDYDSKDLLHEVKSLVRSQENDDACLIFDDTIVSKPYTDENELILGLMDKIGVNFVLFCSSGQNLCCFFVKSILS